MVPLGNGLADGGEGPLRSDLNREAVKGILLRRGVARWPAEAGGREIVGSWADAK